MSGPPGVPGGRPSENGDRPSTGRVGISKMARTLSVKEVVRQIGSQNRDQKLMKLLEELDRDGSGQIDVAELIDMLEGVQRSRKERRYMCYGMITMLVFGVVLIGTIIGLTYAMLYSLKDTEVKGGVMFVKDSDGASAEVVRTGSAEFSVMDGAMVQRVITPDSATNGMGNVLRTADYMGKPQSLNSEIDIRELLELKYLLINGSGNAQLGLVVHGVARVPQEGSLHGTVLHIVTTAGTITLDGTIIAFSTAIANIFAEAGFRVSSTRRALLGSYAVLGFFNTIKDLAAAGKPPSEPEPKLPSENFVMKLKIYEPCVIPDQPDDDRCIYIPPQKPASRGYSPMPELPIALSPPMAPDSPPARADNVTNSTRRALVDALPPAPAASRRRLRHAWVATAPAVFASNQVNNHRRHNRALAEEEVLDLAGVELYKGSRYMTHHETTISYGDKIRVMYDFAIYPLWQKIEVMSGKTVYSWQENVLPSGNSTNEVAQYYCGNYSAASTGTSGFDPKSVVNFTYIGVDSVGEQIARHFELNVLQVSDKSGKTEVMRIEYWDSLGTYAPLRFEFTHKDIGSITIDVVEFRSIDASSPEANPKMFDVPALRPNFTCPNNPSVPRLSTPFMARGAVVPADVPTGADPETSRRMITQSFALAEQWNKLDHVNGTGDWPQWALDMYGGVHPAKREETAARRMLGECGVKITQGVDFEPCGFDYWTYARGAFGMSVRCGGNIGPVEIEGSLELDTCDVIIKGCLSLGIGLPDDNWLVKKIGVDLSIDIASVCVGYNAKEKYFFIEATLTLNLIVFKAELSVQINFSACCVWIASVNLEASIGVSFLNIWVTVGDIDIVSDVYLYGNPEKQEELDNPVAANLATGWLTVGEGFWGDWQKASYPCSKFSYNKAKGSMEVLALPINSYQLRVEPEQGGGDDTALNGIGVGCMSGTANTVEGNNGYWGSWSPSASCPTGGYFIGAKMRIEKQGGDDTAANSVVFQCSNARGTDVVAHSGYWGDWTATRYCPGETYICGLQTRVESSDVSDDTAMNGLRIACCNFPTNTETSVISAGSIKTRGSASSSTCLDVLFNVQSPGTIIQQWACSSDENAAQYFTITSTATGAYTITTTQKGLCLTAQNGGTGSGTRIVLDNCVNGARNQAWAIIPVGNDRADIFTVRPTHASDMCLDISGSSAANGAVVQLWGCNGTPAQSFSLSLPTRANTSPVQALAGENDRCLDVSGNRQNPGTFIQSWDCNETGAQSFTVTAAGTNAYQLKSSGGFCMTVQNAGSFSGARIIIDRCVNGAGNQLWRASAGFQGGVSLSPFHATNLCLDVSNGSTNNGAVVQLWNCNGAKSQSWKVTLPVS